MARFVGKSQSQARGRRRDRCLVRHERCRRPAVSAVQLRKTVYNLWRGHEQDDWQEHACAVSGLPYYHSPSRQRSSWTAQGRFAVWADTEEEEAQFDEADIYAGSERFEGTNPVHGD